MTIIKEQGVLAMNIVGGWVGGRRGNNKVKQYKNTIPQKKKHTPFCFFVPFVLLQLFIAADKRH